MPTPVSKVYGHNISVQVGTTVDTVTTWTNYLQLNSDRSFTGTGSQIDDVQVDLDDLSLPATVTRRGQSIDTSFGGTGMVHATTLSDTMSWFENQESRLCRVKFGNAVTVEGQYILANVEIKAENQETATITVSFVQAEKPTFS